MPSTLPGNDRLFTTSGASAATYIGLGMATLAVFISGLVPETTVDSAKYAAVSRQILETGDFLHLQVRGEPYLQKPPLLFWLGALSFKVFGMSIVAFKLPTLLITMLGIWSTFRLGTRMYGRTAGILSAVIFGSSEAVLLYTMDVHTDLLLTSFVIFSTWQLLEFLERRSALPFVLGFAGMGLAMISKGLAGLVIPAVAVLAWMVAKRDWKALFSPWWLAGIAIVGLVLFPALKGLHDQFGWEGLKFYFWSNNVDRMRGQFTDGHRDLTFCFHTFLYIFLPWSVYAYLAFAQDAIHLVRKRFRGTDPRSSSLYAPLILMVVLITTSRQQSPHYLLPVLPMTAILTGRFVLNVAVTGDFPRTLRAMPWIRTTLVVVLWAATLALPAFFFPTGNPLIWLALAVLLLVTIYASSGRFSATEKLMLPMVAAILALGLTVNAVYMPSALQYHGPIRASYHYNELTGEPSTLYTYDYILYEPYFYPREPARWIERDDLKEQLPHMAGWMITTETGYRRIREMDASVITEIHAYPYKKLTNVSLRFLNPGTRQETLKKVYLLKIR